MRVLWGLENERDAIIPPKNELPARLLDISSILSKLLEILCLRWAGFVGLGKRLLGFLGYQNT
jgi:hypothetical protein